jgi:uncharacterized protein (TIGR02145 family)
MNTIYRFFVALVFLLLYSGANVFCQVSIDTDNGVADHSAMLDIKSAGKGILIPRLTQVQIEGITPPANGLLVFCTDDNTFYAYVASLNSWKEVQYGTGTLTFTCGNPITDVRDGKTYNTVLIGTQCWMMANLNFGKSILTSQNQTNNDTIEKYCYNDEAVNCDVYGALYQWDEMMNYAASSNSNPSGRQGICPAGWHIPSDAEWCQMNLYLDPTYTCSWFGYSGADAGGKLKEAGTIHWASPNAGATNSSGFTGLPGGGRYPDGTSQDLAYFAYFWSSSSSFSQDIWYMILASTSPQEGRYSNSRTFGFSIRCVKD